MKKLPALGLCCKTTGSSDGSGVTANHSHRDPLKKPGCFPSIASLALQALTQRCDELECGWT